MGNLSDKEATRVDTCFHYLADPTLPVIETKSTQQLLKINVMKNTIKFHDIYVLYTGSEHKSTNHDAIMKDMINIFSRSMCRGFKNLTVEHFTSQLAYAQHLFLVCYNQANFCKTVGIAIVQKVNPPNVPNIYNPGYVVLHLEVLCAMSLNSEEVAEQLFKEYHLYCNNVRVQNKYPDQCKQIRTEALKRVRIDMGKLLAYKVVHAFANTTETRFHHYITLTCEYHLAAKYYFGIGFKLGPSPQFVTEVEFMSPFPTLEELQSLNKTIVDKVQQRLNITKQRAQYICDLDPEWFSYVNPEGMINMHFDLYLDIDLLKVQIQSKVEMLEDLLNLKHIFDLTEDETKLQQTLQTDSNCLVHLINDSTCNH